ncbi:MAG: 1-(5-phosphoribosyl)-5-[(5-phosphoribosylamino)methylideneamino]imidazole-4-carboxamide isomerase [Desulfobacteraceae bacterium]|nr:MAG: 1-(5-phosphoribosyl)-5-[(5-phosphoribosylamino)methylideneamino]imidazole-4-carboxamide isomerase [Desulfobacteraceae bacterium]
MIIVPAVDIKGGRCVRLLQGRMDAETVFANDPLEMARRWESAGASLIHIVDLDGAIDKKPRNRSVIRKIIEATKVSVQVGGGIRNEETARMYLELGAARVIIGTEAIRTPSLVESLCSGFPGRIVVGIDARSGRVAIEGWTETTDIEAVVFAKRFEEAGVAAINFTDIHRDGMQTGPNIEETRRLAEAVRIPVFASGGVSSLEDIKKLYPLHRIGLAGVIVGRALYSGSLDLEAAVKWLKENEAGRQSGSHVDS